MDQRGRDPAHGRGDTRKSGQDQPGSTFEYKRKWKVSKDGDRNIQSGKNRTLHHKKPSKQDDLAKRIGLPEIPKPAKRGRWSSDDSKLQDQSTGSKWQGQKGDNKKRLKKDKSKGERGPQSFRNGTGGPPKYRNKKQDGPANQKQEVTCRSSAQIGEYAVPSVSPGFDIKYRQEPIFKNLLQVGEGTYGKVYKAENQETGALVALKRLRLENEREGFPTTALREIRLLQSLSHFNVVALCEIVISGKLLHMAFEYVEHDLAGLLLNPDLNLTKGHIKHLFRQAMEGLAYLHHKSIVHRDIKGSNILVDARGNVKLADFGLARKIDVSVQGVHYTNRVITLWYRPPELLLGATVYGSAVDLWSMGCLLVELNMKSALFRAKDEISQLEKIFEILGSPFQNDWPEAEKLPWFYLLDVPRDGINRLADTFSDASVQGYDLAMKLLAMNPENRIVAKDVLEHPYFREDPQPEIVDLGGTEWHDFEAKVRRKQAPQARQIGPIAADSGPQSAGSALGTEPMSLRDF